MTDLRKAAEMALDVLLDPNTRADEVADAVKALRQALAQPEQEPVAWLIQYKDRHEFVWCNKTVSFKEQVLGIEPLYTAPVDAAIVTEVGIWGEKPPVKTYCGGKPNYCTPVNAVNMSQEVADNLIRTYVSAALANNKNLVAEATKEMINYVCSFIENTAAPKKEWVGLTDEDVHDAFNYVEMVKLLDFDRDRQAWCENFAAHIEAMLKQKNGFSSTSE